MAISAPIPNTPDDAQPIADAGLGAPPPLTCSGIQPGSASSNLLQPDGTPACPPLVPAP